MTINKALNISLSGLNANQAALNVVSHNIANMNTEGYVRKRVNFAEVVMPTKDKSVMGQIASLSGVKVASITTASNDYLNNYYRTQNSIYEGLISDAETAAQLADLMDELKGTGLGYSLTEFFNAANALNQNPTDYSLRINYAEKAKAVANKFNSMSVNVNNLRESKVGNGASVESAEASQIGTDVTKLNSCIQQLLDVNKQISNRPDDVSLHSQRDQILSEISSIANVTTTINSTGTANVSLGGLDLITNCEIQNTLSVTASGSVLATDTKNNVHDLTDKITGGTLGGTIGGLSAIDRAMSAIDTLAGAFADAMNGIQRYVDGDTKACSYDRANDILVPSTVDMFSSKDGNPINASNITINEELYNNPDLIAAARVDTSVTGWEKSVGNGDNALEFYTIQNEKLGALGHLTINDYLISLGTKFGLEAAEKANAADVQGDIVDGIQNQILSETGVNLDEELTNMIIYQQAYNASARVFSACVEIYDTLVALGT